MSHAERFKKYQETAAELGCERDFFVALEQTKEVSPSALYVDNEKLTEDEMKVVEQVAAETFKPSMA